MTTSIASAGNIAPERSTPPSAERGSFRAAAHAGAVAATDPGDGRRSIATRRIVATIAGANVSATLRVAGLRADPKEDG